MDNKNIVKNNKLSLIDYFLITSIFFPWLSFRTNDLDSQPWALVACIVYIFSQKIYSNQTFKLISLLLLLSFTIITFPSNGNLILIIRSFTGYAQIFLVILCSYALKHSGKNFLKIILAINCIWLFAAFLQTILGPYILDFLVTVRTSETRGVTSLAPEPTFFAVFIIVISWIIIEEIKILSKGIIFLLAINFISVVFLAKSSMGLLYLAAILILWLIIKGVNNLFKFFIILSLFVVFSFTIDYSLNLIAGTRLHDIVTIIAKSPLLLVEVDASVNDRLSHIYHSISGFIDGFSMPHGINAFSNYVQNADGAYKHIFWSASGDKIMSWAGAMLFELGFAGLFMYAAIINLMWLKRDLSSNLFAISVFILISLAAIPHGFSPLAALIGFYAAEKQHLYCKISRKSKNQQTSLS